MSLVKEQAYKNAVKDVIAFLEHEADECEDEGRDTWALSYRVAASNIKTNLLTENVNKTYNKLVRDKIPEIIESTGGTPRCYVLTSTEYRQALIEKLIEETLELSNASTKHEILEELADIGTVLCALIKTLGFGEFEVAKAAHKKEVEKGGFDKRIFLEGVINNDLP